MARSENDILNSLPQSLKELPKKWAQKTPDAIAVLHGGKRITYADFWQDISIVSEKMVEFGVSPGDRVGLIIENCYEALCLFFAIVKINACAVMANARLSEREIEVILHESDAKGALYAPIHSPVVARHAERVAGTIIKTNNFAAMIATINSRSQPELFTDDPSKIIAAMLFTSGTTGTPKGALFTQKTILYQASMVSERRNFGPGDCPYVVAPMVHVLGLSGMIIPLIFSGAAMELAARFDVEKVIHSLKTGYITHLYGAAPMFAAIIDKVKKTQEKINATQLKEILAGGAFADEALRASAEEVFGIPLGTGYAATECTPISASTPEKPPNKGAVGQPWHGMEIKVVDRNGNEVERGEVGEIWCRGLNVMDGYFRKPEATAEVMRPEGWIAIGDLVYLDQDGEINIVGRLKEMINRSGFNVYPAEIEAVLNSHPDVLQSAVIGRSIRGNEEVIAFIEAKNINSINIDSVKDYVKSNLAPYKNPSEVVVLKAMPLGPTGKIAKKELRKKLIAVKKIIAKE